MLLYYLSILGFMVIIGLCIWFIYFKHSDKNKVLTGIVCIDRDFDLSQKLYDALIENNVKDIMIVTRESDENTIQFWKNKAKTVTVPHYEINGRHNMDKISEKRQIIVNYAKQRYDAVWFVDSDVIPRKGILDELIKTNKDVCLAPCRVKWVGCPCIGISSNTFPYVKIHKIDDLDKKEDRKPFIIGGFACTLIKKSTFDIKIEDKGITHNGFTVSGEDIGFFINCYNAGLTCEYLTNHEQPHYYDRQTGDS
jgi:hypothetical protein